MVSSPSQRSLTFLLWLALAIAGHVLDTRAAGLTLAPTRILMTGNQRVASVQLANKGDTPLTYRIFLRDKRMLESGRIVDADDGPRRGERFAAELLRYAPRQVVVPPHGSQTVRLMLRNPGDDRLSEGEYRTHLVFRSLPPAPTGDDEGHVRARAIIETSIPVIIRRGHFDAAISLTDARLDTIPGRDGRPRLNVTLERQGERSVYGVLTVTWEHDGESSEIARMAGLAVYTPTPRRRIVVPLQVDSLSELVTGDLIITYQETPDGGGDLSAQTRLRLTGGAEI